jgi:hypothetical protein
VEDCRRKRKAPPGASIWRDAPGSCGVRDPVHVRTHLVREPGGPVSARGRWSRGTRREVLRTYADDERTREVGQSRSTREVPEQRRATGRGGDGGKGSGQRKLAPVQRAPDTEPGRRAQCAGAGTSSGKTGQNAAVHRAPAPYLRHPATPDGVPRAEARCRAGCGWRDVAARRGGAGGTSPGPCRTAETRGVSGQAGSAGVHPEGRRAATAARSHRAGRQNRPARDCRRAERHLRNGLPRLLVWGSGRAAASTMRWTRSTPAC